MSHDPWECTFAPPLDVTDNPLDLHDSMEDRTRLPMAFTQEAADWLSDAGRALRMVNRRHKRMPTQPWPCLINLVVRLV